MKLVICDDEPIERTALRRIVERHLPGIEVAAEAATGRQAILLADEHRPDLMTMDIKMPGIDGLAAIREIRERHPRVRFILVSAYDTFHYAQEAIRLGVADFILKPSSPAAIVESIRGVVRDIERERKKEEEHWRLLERLGRLSPLAERQLVADLLAGRPTDAPDVFDPDGAGGYALAVCTEPEPSPAETEKIVETLKAWNPVWAGAFRGGCLPVVVRRTSDAASRDDDGRDARRSELATLAERLRKALPGRTFRLAAGRVVRGPGQFALSFGDAVMLAWRAASLGESILVADGPAPGRGDGANAGRNGPTRGMIEAIRSGNETDALRFCATALAEWQATGLSARDALVALSAVLGHVFRDDAAASPQRGWTADAAEWRAAVEDNVRRLARLHGGGGDRRARLRAFAEAAMEFLRERYADDLRLEEAADRFGLSPSHFCRMFKEACGMTFVEALTGIRVEAARRELERGRSVKEAAFAAGYRDPDYFARVFRKTVGVSPARYAGSAKKDG